MVYKKILIILIVLAVIFSNIFCSIDGNTKEIIKNAINIFIDIVFPQSINELCKSKSQNEITIIYDDLELLNDIIKSHILYVLNRDTFEITVQLINNAINNINKAEISDDIKIAVQQIINYLLIKLDVETMTDKALSSDTIEIIKSTLSHLASVIENYIEQYKNPFWNSKTGIIKFKKTNQKSNFEVKFELINLNKIAR